METEEEIRCVFDDNFVQIFMCVLIRIALAITT